MRSAVFDYDQGFLGHADLEPRCGVDFCDRCGDCLGCWPGDACWDGRSTHGLHRFRVQAEDLLDFTGDPDYAGCPEVSPDLPPEVAEPHPPPRNDVWDRNSQILTDLMEDQIRKRQERKKRNAS